MYVAQSDEVLLRRFCRERDEQAFSEIVRRYAGFVFAACHRVLQDRTWAEDVSQETFLRLMRKPETIERSLGGWLHKAATQLAIDALRSNSSRRAREATYACECEREASSWQEISPYVDEALEEMPEEMRVLLVRHFLEGISQRDLAAEVGTSTSTISRRIQQGLVQLRQKLRGKGVIVAALLLAESLALDTAEAAPPTLMRELGKMAMMSGPSPSAPASAGPGTAGSMGGLPAPASYGLGVKMAALALVGAGLVALTLGSFWLQLNRPAGSIRRAAPEAPVVGQPVEYPHEQPAASPPSPTTSGPS